MIIVRDQGAWREWRRQASALSLGFIPTLGGLHRGHLSLVARSRAENQATAVSIYLNPTQFDDPADLASYPANLEEDLQRLRGAGVDAVLLPGDELLYPDAYRYRVTETELSRKFCGAHRPGHFDGVLTVVLKLLNWVRPDRAYFGEKDYQQLELVRGLAQAFFLETEIVACPTVREPDGLALSSRNRRLDATERALAPELQRALREAPDAGSAERRLVRAGFTVDYVCDTGERRLAAAWLGSTRLIDNVPLGGEDGEEG